MRICSILLLLLACIAIPAAATPSLCPTSGTYDQLIATNAAGGCIIADKVFSDFTYGSSNSNSGAIVVPSTAFQFESIGNAPVEVGFRFLFALTAATNQTNDIGLSWLVSGPNITSLHLSMSGGTLQDGVATIFETYCLGGPVSTCGDKPAGQLATYSALGMVKPTDGVSFAPITKVGVQKDINLYGGSLPGSFATISIMSQTVDQLPTQDDTPEPATMFVGGASLAGLALLRRLRGAKQ